jgi:O-antigen ligase
MFAAVPLAVEVVFSTASGRRQAGLTYDPNDLAFLIGALLPLLLVRAPFVSNRLTRWVLYGVVILYLVAAVLTQSRGGMTGIASMAIFLAWVGIGQISSRGDFVTGRSGRWVRIALVLCFGALSMLFMPHDAKQRLGTVFDISDDYNLVVSEDGSGRLAIWKRGLETLAERPWGVGANVYGVADALAGGRYMTAHNSLLQVFVELGVPGGLIFISMLVSTWRMNGSVRKGILARKPTPERSELLALTTGLRASMVAIVVAGSFLSQAYGLVLFVIIALSVASAMVSEAECSGDEPNSKKILQTRMPRRSGRVPVAPRSSAAHLH